MELTFISWHQYNVCVSCITRECVFSLQTLRPQILWQLCAYVCLRGSSAMTEKNSRIIGKSGNKLRQEKCSRVAWVLWGFDRFHEWTTVSVRGLRIFYLSRSYFRFRLTLPDRMKNMPETKARMVRCGRMCPILLITKAVKTKSRETMGKGVAVRTISEEKKGRRISRRRSVWHE